MKKSLLALFLVLVMCLSLFCTSCSSGDDETPNVLNTSEADITPMTITLYAPTNSTTTKDQVKLVEDAFNKITEAKFNTHIVLNLIPEAEYEDVIYDRLEGLREQAAAELEDETKKPNVTPLSDNSKYPGIKDDQLDIFLVNSFETYYALATGTYYKPASSDEMTEGALYPLDDALKESATLLNSYTYPYLLRAAKINDIDTGTQGVFGVFNNTVFGEYQYLLLNKELVDKYNYDPENMNDLASISLFLKEVKMNEAGVIPFLGDIDAPVIYWDDTKSLLGAYIGTDLTSSGTINATSYLPQPLAPTNLFNSADYRVWLREYNSLFNANCFVEKTDANANSKFAATIITGDVTLSPTYADVYGNYKVDDYGFKYITRDGVDYYVSVYRRPIANEENIFNAGYVVSAYTEDVDRCMEIITALNTDATLANLFMYGVQDIHYTLNAETGVVTKLTNTYSMDIETVGNIYLLNPSDDMNDFWKFMSANKWQNAKNTNLEAVLSPFAGFTFNPEKPMEDEVEDGKVYVDLTFEQAIAEIQKVSPDFFEKALKYVETPDMPFADFIKTVYDEVAKNEAVSAVTDDVTGVYSMLEAYRDWYEGKFDVKLEENA